MLEYGNIRLMIRSNFCYKRVKKGVWTEKGLQTTQGVTNNTQPKTLDQVLSTQSRVLNRVFIVVSFGFEEKNIEYSGC